MEAADLKSVWVCPLAHAGSNLLPRCLLAISAVPPPVHHSQEVSGLFLSLWTMSYVGWRGPVTGRSAEQSG
eukprot:447388-Pelagomonas_calceolata.AAC.3